MQVFPMEEAAIRRDPKAVIFLLLDSEQPDDEEVRITASIAELIQGSSVFSSMFSHPWILHYHRDVVDGEEAIIVPIHDVDPLGFGNVIDFLVSNRLHLSSVEAVLETLRISTRFLVTTVSIVCVQYLAANLTRGNVLQIFDVLVRYCPINASAVTSGSSMTFESAFNNQKKQMHGGSAFASPMDCQADLDPSGDTLSSLMAASESLTASCLLLIATDAEHQLRDESWVELNCDAVHMILSMDTLNISDERVVVEAVLNWASYRCQQQQTSAENLRKMLPPQILFSIRLSTLTAVEFVDLASQVQFSPEESSFILASIAMAGEQKSYHCASNFAFEVDEEAVLSKASTNCDAISRGFSPPSTILPYLHVLSRGRTGMTQPYRWEDKKRKKASRSIKTSGSVDAEEDVCCPDRSIWSCWRLCFGWASSVFNMNRGNDDRNKPVRESQAVDASSGTTPQHREDQENLPVLSAFTSVAAWIFD